MSSIRHVSQALGLAALVIGVAPSPTHAQHGHGGAHVVHPVVVGGWYSPFYYPFWGYGWWGPWGWPYGHYGYYDLIQTSSARVQVTPRNTEVYVDGYLAGTADDFDGFAQRLRVDPGEHTIELYLDGHKSVTQLIYFQPGETYHLRYTMEPLAGGDTPPARPTPQSPTRPPYPGGRRGPGPMGPHGPRGPAPPEGRSEGAGTLAIRVQPADAVVLIDGERWEGSGGQRLDVQVAPGPHRVEVQKDGYQTFSTTVQVRPGESTPLNVSLTKQ